MKAMQAAVLLILRSLGIELKETVFFLTCLCLELSWKQKGVGEGCGREGFLGYTLYLYSGNSSEYFNEIIVYRREERLQKTEFWVSLSPWDFPSRKIHVHWILIEKSWIKTQAVILLIHKDGHDTLFQSVNCAEWLNVQIWQTHNYQVLSANLSFLSNGEPTCWGSSLWRWDTVDRNHVGSSSTFDS